MHDLLFEDQRELSEEKIEGYAKRLQLDMRRFRKEIADPELKAYVEADQAQATKFGARGTPTFFINGRVLTGAQPFDRFKEKIEAELERADTLLKKGVPRAELYDRLTADGEDGA
jgi:protein-disulfide isomerase